MAIAFTEMFVSHASGADPTNGGGPLGANDGPVWTGTGTVTAGTLTTIVPTADPTASVAAGMLVNWYNGATWERRVVASVTSITIVVLGADLTAAIAQPVRVGGAIGCIQSGLDAMKTTLVKAATATDNFSPRLNLPTGTTFNEAVTATNSGTTAIPLRIEGYTTNPGDIDSEVSTVRVPIQPVVMTITTATATNPCVVTTTGNHNFGVGQIVKIASAAGGTWASLNGDRTITAKTDTTLTFAAVDASGYGSYTASSGTASPFDGGTAKSCIVDVSSQAYSFVMNVDVHCSVAAKDGIFLSTTGLATNCITNVTRQGFGKSNSSAYIRCAALAGTIGFQLGSAPRMFRCEATGQTIGGIQIDGSGTFLDGVSVHGNLGAGIYYTGAALPGVLRNCTIVDNALDGLQLGTAAVCFLSQIYNNIIAHNGTVNTGGTLTAASPGKLTIYGQALNYANGTAVQLTGISGVTGVINGLTYFLQRDSGSGTTYVYTLRTTPGGSNINTGGSTDTTVITSKIGFGIASSVTGGPYRLGVNAYNNIYGNACGPIQTFAGNADGTVSLLDNGLHNDATNAPFSGSSNLGATGAAARLGNGYALTAACIGVSQHLPATIGTADSSYPDLGAIQSSEAARNTSPAEANVWKGTGTWLAAGVTKAPSKVPSSIITSGGATGTLDPRDVKKDVVVGADLGPVDQVVGSATGGGGNSVIGSGIIVPVRRVA